MKWIKISKARPQEEGQLWVYDGEGVYLCEYKNKEFGWYLNDYGEVEWLIPDDSITHWKYLSKPNRPKS